MSVSEATVKARLITEMTARGFNPLGLETEGQAELYIEAIAAAIAKTITQDALVVIPGGSSSGSYSIT